jgi:hypothetical protein
MPLSLGNEVEDSEWGCVYQLVLNTVDYPNIKLCFVRVKSLHDFAARITDVVLDDSWMTSLDRGTRRAYDKTAKETANLLVEIFKQTSGTGTIGADFGELMVSLSASHALEKMLSHVAIPIAELWKPQLKQNEGFDFHTVCSTPFINFGEAKFSGAGDPYGLAIEQANTFIGAEKHLRDHVHLRNLVAAEAVDHLNYDKFGVVAAFSINAKKPLYILTNALEKAKTIVNDRKLATFYLVGVINEC